MLFAGNRVLHRLLVPRHPPYALCNLTEIFVDTQINHLTGDEGVSEKYWTGKLYGCFGTNVRSLVLPRRSGENY